MVMMSKRTGSSSGTKQAIVRKNPSGRYSLVIGRQRKMAKRMSEQITNPPTTSAICTQKTIFLGRSITCRVTQTRRPPQNIYARQTTANNPTIKRIFIWQAMLSSRRGSLFCVAKNRITNTSCTNHTNTFVIINIQRKSTERKNPSSLCLSPILHIVCKLSAQEVRINVSPVKNKRKLNRFNRKSETPSWLHCCVTSQSTRASKKRAITGRKRVLGEGVME